MKKILSICFLILMISFVFGQDMVNPYLSKEKPIDTRPRNYFGLSTGINNMVGLLGVQLDIGILRNVSIGGGAGLSSWGFKYSGNLRVSSKGSYGFTFKTGYSHNTGLEDFETELEVSSGATKPILMDLKPMDNIFFTLGWAWKIGKRNRMYVEGGYAIPLTTEDYYTLHDQIMLSETSKDVMQVLRPGGLIIAFGVNFALSSF